MDLEGFMALVDKAVKRANLETAEVRPEDLQAMRKALLQLPSQSEAKDAVGKAMRNGLIRRVDFRRVRVLAEINKAVFYQATLREERRIAGMSHEEKVAELERLASRGAMGDMRPSDHGSLTLELHAWRDQVWRTLGNLRATSGDRWPSVRRSIEEFLEDDSKGGPL